LRRFQRAIGVRLLPAGAVDLRCDGGVTRESSRLGREPPAADGDSEPIWPCATPELADNLMRYNCLNPSGKTAFLTER